MQVKKVGLHRLIDRLTSRAMSESLLCSSNRGNGEKHRPLKTSDMPGHLIKQLKPEERKALSKAKAEDFSWRGFK